jgi:hypothetical protein
VLALDAVNGPLLDFSPLLSAAARPVGHGSGTSLGVQTHAFEFCDVLFINVRQRPTDCSESTFTPVRSMAHDRERDQN